MKLNELVDILNQRCKALHALGFNCVHRDSNVEHPAVPGIKFDFSATAEEHFLAVALKHVMKEGKRIGANGIRSQFADMMVLEPSDE
jgi:hypothetical protein